MTRGYPTLTSRLSSSAHRAGFALLFAAFAAILASTPVHAQSAGGWNKRGQAAELREDYDTAYEAYLKAHQKSPKDMRYQARVDRMRFQAAAQHVDRGRVIRQSGDLSGALNQFTRALQIDPGNEAAAQEIQITQRMDRPAASTPAGPTAAESSLMRDIGGAAGPIELKPVSEEPIILNTIEDTKNIYTAIGKLAGLNVIFDPDFRSTRQPIDLKGVSLADALRVVGMISSSFYKPVTADTIFVAPNTKHHDLDDLAVQTFFLTNAAQQSDANEIVTALRQIVGADDNVYLVPSQNAIVVRAPPNHLVLVEKVLNDLDRTRAEVVVDVAILEVNRDKIRNLGITLPQSFGITPQATPNATNTTAGNGTGTNSGTATVSSNFTLNTLGNINATNFGVTIGGGTLNALMTDADTRVLQNPSIRATDGQNAKLKIGSKIPVATGSYSAGAATGITAGIGVQTQFTYLDVGVNIDMTPTIHLDREVSLKLDIVNSTQSGQVTISGVTEPILGQRESQTTIQLRDGEPCLLAGILDREENNSNSGTPGLSSIPLLKYFFGSVYHENKQDEVVFILVPHIVRESVLTGLNTRAIDTGTKSDIQIRRSDTPYDDRIVTPGPPPPSNVTAANAAAAMVQQMKQQAAPPTPGTPRTAAPPTASAGAVAAGIPVVLTVLPRSSNQTVGSTFQASILLSNAHDVVSAPVQLQFDPKILQLVNVDTGGLLGGDGQPVALVHKDDGAGLVTISASRPPGVAGVNGEGELCTLTFKAIGPGDSNITLVKMAAQNSLNANLPASGAPAVVHVK